MVDLTVIQLYSEPDKKVDGFNKSLNDAINLSETAQSGLFTLLDEMIKARQSDAYFHHIRDRDVHEGHAHVYGLTKWLRHSYVPSLLPQSRGEPKLTKEENEHYISVYEQEFINLYEQYNTQRPLTPAAASRTSNAAEKWRNLGRGTQKPKRKRSKKRQRARRRSKKRRGGKAV